MAIKFHADRNRWSDVVIFWNDEPLPYDAQVCYALTGDDTTATRTHSGTYAVYGASTQG